MVALGPIARRQQREPPAAASRAPALLVLLLMTSGAVTRGEKVTRLEMPTIGEDGFRREALPIHDDEGRCVQNCHFEDAQRAKEDREKTVEEVGKTGRRKKERRGSGLGKRIAQLQSRVVEARREREKADATLVTARAEANAANRTLSRAEAELKEVTAKSLGVQGTMDVFASVRRKAAKLLAAAAAAVSPDEPESDMPLDMPDDPAADMPLDMPDDPAAEMEASATDSDPAAELEASATDSDPAAELGASATGSDPAAELDTNAAGSNPAAKQAAPPQQGQQKDEKAALLKDAAFVKPQPPPPPTPGRVKHDEIFEDGSQYSGEWKVGKEQSALFDGYGTRTMKEGHVYVGQNKSGLQACPLFAASTFFLKHVPCPALLHNRRALPTAHVQV